MITSFYFRIPATRLTRAVTVSASVGPEIGFGIAVQFIDARPGHEWFYVRYFCLFRNKQGGHTGAIRQGVEA